MFDQDIPVKLSGVVVVTLKGSVSYEEVTESPREAEIGTSVMTVTFLDPAPYNALSKNNQYVFVVDSVPMKRRGPALEDAGGVKIYLTRA
jgi:hypothetical protein